MVRLTWPAPALPTVYGVTGITPYRSTRRLAGIGDPAVREKLLCACAEPGFIRPLAVSRPAVDRHDHRLQRGPSGC